MRMGVGRIVLVGGVLLGLGCGSPGVERRLNDETALQTVRDICKAENTHFLVYGTYSTLRQLAAANPGTKIAKVLEDGYAGHRFELRTQDEGFAILASPIERKVTGFTDFYCDETGVMRFAMGSKANAQSPVPNGSE
jgi:hypothetical protein